MAVDKKKVVKITKEFGNSTTLHGLPQVINSKSPKLRSFWAGIFICSVCVFVYQTTCLLVKYYQYPTKVNFSIKQAPTAFPSVSVCNIRNMDVFTLNQLNEYYLKNAIQHVPYLNDTPAFKAYKKASASFMQIYWNSPYYDLVEDLVTRSTFASNLKRQYAIELGSILEEFVITCRFGANSCNIQEDFKHFFDAVYYNCYTYTPNLQGEENVAYTGLENAWSTVLLSGNGLVTVNEDIRMIPGTEDIHSIVSGSEGVRVVIHPPGTEPYPQSEGFDVPPGFSVTLGMKTLEFIRLGQPHGECSSTSPFGNDEYVYTLLSCQKMCAQKAVVKKCGCLDIILPGHKHYPNVTYCATYGDMGKYCLDIVTDDCQKAWESFNFRVNCARNITREVMKNTSAHGDCHCASPCHEIKYDLFYSLAKWPADSFDGEVAFSKLMYKVNQTFIMKIPENETKKREMYGDYFSIKNRHVAKKQFTKMTLYLSDSNVMMSEETEDYPQSELLSDIGGQMELWVGISILSLVEVLQYFIHLLKYVHVKRSNARRQSEQEQKELDQGAKQSLTNSNHNNINKSDV